MLLDRDGFFDCNQRTLDLFGVDSVEAFTNYQPWELSPSIQPDGADSKEAADDHVETAFEEGEAFFEWTHQRADGSEFPAEVKLSRFEHDGEPALHALVRDITERKEYERRLETQRDNLNILNQVLRHDIRNDIQLITAYGELIEDQCDDDELQEHVETVLENADHAVELTKSAREMADVMLSTDKELQQVSLPAVLESEIEDVRDSFPEAVITKEEALPIVSVQANDMLGSVFRNLLKNAIQHNDKELPKVTISATDHDETIVVRVADNGPGVPDVQKETIFGKGEKGLDSQGTGIGLYLVKTLVESYNGKIWVEDREGENFAADRPDATDRTEREGRDTRADSGGEREGAVFVVELPKVEDG
jgi:PAS domain S-box-containing protein